MERPDPFSEIRLVSLRSIRGASFWSRRPVTRMDVDPGAYDDISSAAVPGFTEALLAALPGLWEHRCSVGERGGFVARLRDGTYAPHIAEHVGLELQSMAGHDVGYGRARGGDRPGEYTVVFEHLHAEVGLRSAALALEVVQRALAGTLDGVGHAVAELRALARAPDAPPLRHAVRCGVTGGGDRGTVRAEMLRRGVGAGELVVDVSPAYLLNVGLPYSASEVAVILDDRPLDVPERYRDPEMAGKLVSVLADAVPAGGAAVVPAGAWDVHERAADAGCRLAVFADAERLSARDARDAHAAAVVRGGRMVLDCGGDSADGGPLRPGVPAAPQLAGALAVLALQRMQPDPRVEEDGPVP
jgi:cyanophycin synthetase